MNLILGYLVHTEAGTESDQLIKRCSPAICLALCKIFWGVKICEFPPSRTYCWEQRVSHVECRDYCVIYFQIMCRDYKMTLIVTR